MHALLDLGVVLGELRLALLLSCVFLMSATGGATSKAMVSMLLCSTSSTDSLTLMHVVVSWRSPQQHRGPPATITVGPGSMVYRVLL
jgi:hypothetical protein